MTAVQPPAPAEHPAAGAGTPALDEQAAEWIRDHVWTSAMRTEYREKPDADTTCPCQWGPTSHCQRGAHDQCHRATPLRSYASMICGPDGVTPAAFPGPYEHEVDTFATGPQPTSYALVWLADRVCRWACSCPCHTAPAAATTPVQLDLFGAAA